MRRNCRPVSHCLQQVRHKLFEIIALELTTDFFEDEILCALNDLVCSCANAFILDRKLFLESFVESRKKLISIVLYGEEGHK